jgi:hypothetical protein
LLGSSSSRRVGQVSEVNHGAGLSGFGAEQGANGIVADQDCGTDSCEDIGIHRLKQDVAVARELIDQAVNFRDSRVEPLGSGACDVVCGLWCGSELGWTFAAGDEVHVPRTSYVEEFEAARRADFNEVAMGCLVRVEPAPSPRRLRLCGLQGLCSLQKASPRPGLGEASASVPRDMGFGPPEGFTAMCSANQGASLDTDTRPCRVCSGVGVLPLRWISPVVEPGAPMEVW